MRLQIDLGAVEVLALAQLLEDWAAEDAVVVDTSDMTLDEVIARLGELVAERTGAQR